MTAIEVIVSWIVIINPVQSIAKSEESFPRTS